MTYFSIWSLYIVILLIWEILSMMHLHFAVQIVSYCVFLLRNVYLVDMGNVVHDVISNEAFLFFSFFLHFAVQILWYYAFCGYCIYEALVFLLFTPYRNVQLYKAFDNKINLRIHEVEWSELLGYTHLRPVSI